MVHLQFELNFDISMAEKEAFAEEVREVLSTIMETGKNHIDITICNLRPHRLPLPTGGVSGDGSAFVNAEIRQGCTRDQRRRLSLAVTEEIHSRWQIPKKNMKVVLTETPRGDFQSHDAALSGWSGAEGM